MAGAACAHAGPSWRRIGAFRTRTPAPDGGIRIPIRLTQNDMAGMVGASRVSVNKVLVHYKERKYISIDPASRITVHDQAALAQRCQ